MEYRTRFMREVGVRASLRVYWGRTVFADNRVVGGECPNGYGMGSLGIHNAQIFVADKLDGYDDRFGGEPADYPDDKWPTACDHCGAPVPERVLVPCDCGTPGCMKSPDGSPQRQVFRRVLYQAADGATGIRAELEPGDMHWATWFGCDERNGHCHYGWTNCDGRHLIVVCPDGPGRTHPWDVNGRASNCTLKDDTLHRCWVLHGNPETDRITVNKSGKTCGAGGGSIQTAHWHGVLENGVLRGC